MTTIFPPEFLERYEVLGPLGEGGMGVVYKGRQTALDRLVAIKLLSGHLLTQEFQERFRQEARVASQMIHQNVVAVFDYGAVGDVPFIVFEFVDGTSLRALLQAAPLAVEQALSIVRHACDGLAIAHSLGIVHRDIKPENILVAHDGVVKVADFGVAKATLPGTGFKTRTGTIMGTPAYMSPEQVREETLTAASDIYSMGIVLYEALSGDVPFRAPTTIETLQLHLHQPPPPLTSLPQEVQRVAAKALAKEPGLRFPSAASLADDLGRLLDSRYGGRSVPLRGLPTTPVPASIRAQATVPAARPAGAVAAPAGTLGGTRLEEVVGPQAAVSHTRMDGAAVTTLEDSPSPGVPGPSRLPPPEPAGPPGVGPGQGPGAVSTAPPRALWRRVLPLLVAAALGAFVATRARRPRPPLPSPSYSLRVDPASATIGAPPHELATGPLSSLRRGFARLDPRFRGEIQRLPFPRLKVRLFEHLSAGLVHEGQRPWVRTRLAELLDSGQPFLGPETDRPEARQVVQALLEIMRGNEPASRGLFHRGMEGYGPPGLPPSIWCLANIYLEALAFHHMDRNVDPEPALAEERDKGLDLLIRGAHALGLGVQGAGPHIRAARKDLKAFGERATGVSLAARTDAAHPPTSSAWCLVALSHLLAEDPAHPILTREALSHAEFWLTAYGVGRSDESLLGAPCGPLADSLHYRIHDILGRPRAERPEQPPPAIQDIRASLRPLAEKITRSLHALAPARPAGREHAPRGRRHVIREEFRDMIRDKMAR